MNLYINKMKTWIHFYQIIMKQRQMTQYCMDWLKHHMICKLNLGHWVLFTMCRAGGWRGTFDKKHLLPTHTNITTGHLRWHGILCKGLEPYWKKQNDEQVYMPIIKVWSLESLASSLTWFPLQFSRQWELILINNWALDFHLGRFNEPLQQLLVTNDIKVKASAAKASNRHFVLCKLIPHMNSEKNKIQSNLGDPFPSPTHKQAKNSSKHDT